MPIPDAIAGAPRLRDDLRWVWDAFSDLSTERAPGSMGPPGHIPWQAMHAYCAANGLRGDEEAWFVDVIRAMDEVYMEHAARKIEESQKERPGGDA